MNKTKEPKHKAGQVSNEFIFLLGSLLFLLLAFLYAFSGDIKQIHTMQEDDVIYDLGYNLQNEFLTAQLVRDGYKRTFTVPESYYGYEYDIYIINSTLVLISESGFTYEFFIPNSIGNITKGKNQIRKEEGKIYLN